MKGLNKKFILFVLLPILVLINLLILFFSLQEIDFLDQNKVTAKSSQTADLSLCVNPVISMESIEDQCGETLNLQVNDNSTCNLTYNQTDNDVIRFSAQFPYEQAYVLDISSNGLITFLPQIDAWGENFTTLEHEIYIVVSETGHACGEGQQYVFTYAPTIIFENTPPEYIEELPNISMNKNEQLFTFELSDYFIDRDGHQLEYALFDVVPDTLYELDVQVEEENGVVLLQSFDECGDYYLVFEAKEKNTIYQEFTLSDPPTLITIECETEDEGGDDSSSGGGGGGSSGSDLERTCVPEWNCLDWSDCYPPDEDHLDYPDGYKMRECYDENGCSATDYKRTKYAECFYSFGTYGCYPDWDCTEWTPCTKENVQKRNCQDLNKCSVEEQKRVGLPSIVKLCAYSETCLDGTKNNGELGVDCGGPCEPCKEIQLPATIYDSNRVLTLVVGLLSGFLLLLLIIFRIFKTQIKTFISKLVWSLVKRKARQIYLAGKTKEKLLSEFENFQKNFYKPATSSNEELDSKIFILFRKLFSEILEIDFESRENLFVKKINNLDSTEEFKDILRNISSRFFELESKGRKIIIDYLTDLEVDFNSLKFLLFNVSDRINLKEIKDLNLEKSKEPCLSKIMNLVNKSYLALQHNNIEVGKKNYLKIIELYENLEESDKAKVDIITSTLFSIIKYVGSHLV